VLTTGLGKLDQLWKSPEASQGARLCRWSWLGYFPSLVHGTTFETAFWFKIEAEARPLAGTGPTAGRLELAGGNGRNQVQFSSARRPWQRLAQPTIHLELLHLDDFSGGSRDLLHSLHITVPGCSGGELL